MLTDHRLSYYGDHVQTKKALKDIALTSDHRVESLSDKTREGRPFLLRLVDARSGSALYMSAENESERQGWVDAIQQVLHGIQETT